MPKITFKKHPRETGLASVGHPYQNVDLKYKKKVFGTIYAPNYLRSGWRVSIAVKSGENFRWLKVKREFASEEDARNFVTENTDKILGEDLHFFEED